MKVIERLSGVGPVRVGGQVVGRAAYQITRSQREHHVLGQVVDGMEVVQGRLYDPQDGLHFFTLVEADSFVLELEDGRRWECALRGDDTLVSVGEFPSA